MNTRQAMIEHILKLEPALWRRLLDQLNYSTLASIESDFMQRRVQDDAI